MTLEIVYKNTDELIPYVNNSRTHTDEQVTQLASSIKEFGFNNPVLLDGENGIIAGHGRVMAAKKLGMDRIPCVNLSHLSETQRKAYVIADNRLALSAEWDKELLALEIADLQLQEFDIDLLGFERSEISELMGEETTESESEGGGGYSTKVDTPVYTAKGEAPEITELLNSERTRTLLNKINESKISDNEKAFLIQAASRHTVFDYHLIAEYYCHASKEMQELMEDSALVIIDIDKAIQQGYVEMSHKLESIYSDSYDGTDDDEVIEDDE